MIAPAKFDEKDVSGRLLQAVCDGRYKRTLFQMSEDGVTADNFRLTEKETSQYTGHNLSILIVYNKISIL